MWRYSPCTATCYGTCDCHTRFEDIEIDNPAPEGFDPETMIDREED
jgi:hypothetical protein